MNSPNVLHKFDFQLVMFLVAPVMCLFLRYKRRKKGAHTFTAPHGTYLELPDSWKEVKKIKLLEVVIHTEIKFYYTFKNSYS